MSKKLVWLGVVFVVTTIIFISIGSTFAEAYTISWKTFVQQGSRSGPTTTVLQTYTTSFYDNGEVSNNGGRPLDAYCDRPSFKLLSTSVYRITDLVTDHDASGCGGSSKSLPMVKGTLIDVSYFKDYATSAPTFSTTSGLCIPSTSFKCDNSNDCNIILGGYIYVTSPITKLNLGSWVDAGSGGMWDPSDDEDVYVYLSAFKVSGSGVSGIGDPINLATDTSYKYIFAPQTQKSFCNQVSHTDTANALDPGLYYLVYAINFYGDQNNDVWDSCDAYLSTDPSKIREDAYNNNFITSSNYKIFPNYLSNTDIRKTFNVEEIDKYFCIHAGGKKSDSTLLLNSAAAHYGCCRQEYYGLVSNGYLCTAESGWNNISEEDYCKLSNAGDITLNDFEKLVLDNFASSQRLEYINTTKNGTDGCCGDDILDYGYISKIGDRNQFMCYDHNIQSYSSIDQKNYTWLNAMSARDKYKIYTIFNSGQTDVVSNSQDWYYCNALNNNNLNGKPIPNEETFENFFTDGKFSCADMLSSLIGEPFDDKCYKNSVEVSSTDRAPFDTNCCQKDFIRNRPSSAYSVTECVNYCYKSGVGHTITIDELPDIQLPNVGLSSGYVDKDWCVQNPLLCLNGTMGWYNPTEHCKHQQTTFNLDPCNKTANFCKNGILLKTNETFTSPDEMCCVGPDAICTSAVNITDSQSCADVGGRLYSSNQYSCTGYSKLLLTGQSCCIGQLFFNYSSAGSSVSPSAFICFKEDGVSSVISQCCYDSSCANFNYSSSDNINTFSRRVLTKGSSIHTLENFDLFPSKSKPPSLIRDRAIQLTLNENGLNSPVALKLDPTVWALNISKSSYLEFDILTDSETIGLRLTSTKELEQNIDLLSKYYLGGTKPNRWHHVIIPTSDITVNNIYELTFYDSINLQPHLVVLDNIILTPEADKLEYNTKNYYCTGGFEGWINDLDPSTSTTNLGPYMFACSGIASFGWTGNSCCGDDTKLTNYGEFFNDTEAGCFNGTKVTNNKRVSDAYGINEVPILERDGLKDFVYSNLLYYDNVFIGCQVPNNNIGLSFSHDGLSTNEILVNNFTKDQCAVVGDYYCMNGVWRKKILTNENYIEGKEFPDVEIKLKEIPPGAEILKNGFRG